MWFEILLVVFIVLYTWKKGIKNIGLKQIIKLAIMCLIALVIYNYFKNRNV